MKKILFTMIFLSLLGCSRGGHTELARSKATITGLQVEDRGNHEQGYYKLAIEFDYSIENFHPEAGQYRCTIQIMAPDGRPSESAWAGKNCEIRQASGHTSALVTAPRDKELRNITPDRFDPSRFADPVEYSIVILQKLSGDKYLSIGQKTFPAPAAKSTTSREATVTT